MENEHKRYKALIADPPWDINQRGGNNNRGAERHYPLMPLERIKAMPVADLCEENAHLYLWCPNGLIPQALEVINAWGFTYRCSMVWIKPRLGLGNYIRTAHETLLFATRGRAPVKFHAQPSWVFAPQQEHSHKPEEVHDVVERLSPGPYLELFARRSRPGWDIWGNEVESDLEILGYPATAYSSKATGAAAPKEV